MKKTIIKNTFSSINNIFKKKNIIENTVDSKSKQAKDIVGYRCEKCLKEKGLSQICLDNYNPECQIESLNYCAECGEYCENLCDENSGGGSTPIYRASGGDIGQQEQQTSDTSSGVNSDLPECEDGCRQVLYHPRGVPGTDPFSIMYRHTGCHLIWYPPEFAFGNNPNISQCKGLIVREEFENDITGNVASCHPDYANFSPLGSQDGAIFDPACGGGAENPRGSWPLWPCYCRQVPHIRDGIYGTLYKIPNINQTEGQFGYIPYMDVFSPGMLYNEAGCCYCANTRQGAFNRNGSPLWPQTPLSWRAWFNGGAAGVMCTPGSNSTNSLANKNYKESCYEYGISPYLKRISKSDYKIGFDIWTYGGPLKNKQDFGTSYYVTDFNEIGYWFDYNINYRDVSQLTKLQNVLVGFVGLEHHFESYAYKSDDLRAPKIEAVQNHANVLRGKFEKPYGGSFNTTSGCGNFTADNDSNLKWQLYRKTPRRFMYGGAKVPLFHHDLYYFELLSKQKNILINAKTFDAKLFLKAYYNYFYTVVQGKYIFIDPCDGSMKTGTLQYEPIHLFETIKNDYDYVIAALKEMIRYNVLAIKDHAPDIVDEINEVIASAKYVTNQTTQEQELKLNPYVDGVVGGVTGYMDLVNFFGVQPITGKVTVNQVKQYLIDPETGNTEVGVDCAGIQIPGPQSYFRFPRRSFLPPYLQSGDLVGWGCRPVIDQDDEQIGPPPCDGYSNPSANPVFFPETEWTKGKYVDVFSGMHTNYWLLDSGQILGSGYSDGNNLIPPGSISIPPEEEAIRQAERDYTPYGRVKKVSIKSTKLAIALVNFSNGYNFIDPYVTTGCDLYNGGDNSAAPSPSNPSEYSRIIAWGEFKCNGVFKGEADPDNIESKFYNKQEKWVDAASGSYHVAAISTGSINPDETEYDNFLLFFKGDNTNDQAPPLPNNYPANRTAYAPTAKPGYFTDTEWQRYINGTYSLNCNFNNPNDPNSDVRCSLFNNLQYGTLDRPVWSKVGCGQMHSIAVQSDNQVKMWGSYYRINKDGNRDTDIVTNTLCPIVDTFIPDEIKNLAAKWELTFRNNDPEDICTSANVTPQTANIRFLDGGPDYTMLVADNTLYVWGRVEMLPNMTPSNVEDDPNFLRLKETGVYSTTIPGEVVSISAGANCWIVNYKVQDNNNNVDSFISSFPTYETIQWTRKHVYDIDNVNYYDYGFIPTEDEDKSSFGYKGIATGFGHVAAIGYGNLKFPKWDYSLFELEETRKNQFSPQNGKPLPNYFKSFAFFRGLPGGWDFSKWFYGKSCGQGLDTLRAPGGVTTCETLDPCSVLGEPDSNDSSGLIKDNWSYSGHPEYWWMQKGARRYQYGNGFYQSPNSKCLGDTVPNPFCGDGGALQGNNAGAGMLSSCQIDYDLCWQIDSQPINTIPKDYMPDADGGQECQLDCDDTDSGTLVIRKVPNYPWLAKRCTSAIGRVGFRSTKDYFLQSYKIFGLKNNCCSVISTYLSYATYATRNTAFALNETTNVWEIKENPDPYRTGFASNTLKMASTASVTYDKNVKYPLVYVGGDSLRKLESSYYTAIYGSIAANGDIGGCNPANSESLCPYDPSSAGPKILGPGGWLMSILPSTATIDQYSPLSAGVLKQGIFLYNKDAQLKTPYNLIGTNNFGYESGSTFKYCYETPAGPTETPPGATGWASDLCGNSYYIGSDFYEGNPTKPLTCEIKNLIVFDATDQRNYAKDSEMLLTTKWHKINRDGIFIFPGGITGDAGQFAGTLEDYCDVNTNASIYVQQFLVDQNNVLKKLTVYTSTVTCPDACSDRVLKTDYNI